MWYPAWGTLTPGINPPAPVWLRRMLGDEHFQEIAHVSLFADIAKGEVLRWDSGPADELLAKLAGHTRIKTLQFGGAQATNRGMAYVGRIAGLEELIIFPAPEISDDGVAHLTELRNLKTLFVTEFEDHRRRCTSFESVAELGAPDA